MKTRAFALTGAAALALSACGGNNPDAVDNAEMNQPAPELNDLSTEAANDAAAEAAALGTQQQQLEQENAVEEDTTTPTDEQEQNVSGM